jgi:hypothetical protein
VSSHKPRARSDTSTLRRAVQLAKHDIDVLLDDDGYRAGGVRRANRRLSSRARSSDRSRMRARRVGRGRGADPGNTANSKGIGLDRSVRSVTEGPTITPRPRLRRSKTVNRLLSTVASHTARHAGNPLFVHTNRVRRSETGQTCLTAGVTLLITPSFQANHDPALAATSLVKVDRAPGSTSHERRNM